MRILVVDDEKLLVKGITFNLENDGYQVDGAYDGQQALDMLRRRNMSAQSWSCAPTGAANTRT